MIQVTGGAGYVGRAVMRLLGGRARAIDDLSNSRRPIHEPERFMERNVGSVLPGELQGTSAVIHLAAEISPRASVQDPIAYWQRNVGELAAFLLAVPPGVQFVFASSSAVYGNPSRGLVSEDDPLLPLSPYGATKQAGEMLLSGIGLKLSVLRYFNVAGGEESHLERIHLVPRAVEASLGGRPLEVLGDGRQVRDYVHVEDVADATIRALERPGTYNIGSGRGTSVLEVLALVEEVSGRKVPVVWKNAHPADPAFLVADIRQARERLGWEPRRTLRTMIEETWEHLKAC
jgi:UDP-glucose 4-epimerase